MCDKCNKEISLMDLVGSMQKLALKLSETVFSKDKLPASTTNIDEIQELCHQIKKMLECKTNAVG